MLTQIFKWIGCTHPAKLINFLLDDDVLEVG